MENTTGVVRPVFSLTDAGSNAIDGQLLRFAKRAVVVLKKIRRPEEGENSEFSKKGGFYS